MRHSSLRRVDTSALPVNNDKEAEEPEVRFFRSRHSVFYFEKYLHPPPLDVISHSSFLLFCVCICILLYLLLTSHSD